MLCLRSWNSEFKFINCPYAGQEGGGVEDVGWMVVRGEGGYGFACRWSSSVVSSQTAREQDAERGKNDYNSGVTRDMSNTGHMGFTAKGL